MKQTGDKRDWTQRTVHIADHRDQASSWSIDTQKGIKESSWHTAKLQSAVQTTLDMFDLNEAEEGHSWVLSSTQSMLFCSLKSCRNLPGQYSRIYNKCESLLNLVPPLPAPAPANWSSPWPPCEAEQPLLSDPLTDWPTPLHTSQQVKSSYFLRFWGVSQKTKACLNF